MSGLFSILESNEIAFVFLAMPGAVIASQCGSCITPLFRNPHLFEQSVLSSFMLRLGGSCKRMQGSVFGNQELVLQETEK